MPQAFDALRRLRVLDDSQGQGRVEAMTRHRGEPGRTIIKALALAAILLTLGLQSAFAQQASPIEAKLILPDTRVLPGVPFEMWIEVWNPSDTAVTFGLFPRLLVRNDRGESFEILSDDHDYPILLKRSAHDGGAPLESLTLERNEKATLTLPLRDGLRGAQFFRDYRLSPPGRYVLAIRLESFPIGGFRSSARPIADRGPVTTSEAVVERIEPTGSDMKVWQRMQEIAKGQWTTPLGTIAITNGDLPFEEMIARDKIWDEILTKYPDSNYVPYALVAYGGDDYLKRVADAVTRFPESPVLEPLQLAAWRSACGHPAGAQKRTCDGAWTTLQQSKRPTTRIRVFGREDTGKEPCPPEYDCEN